MRVLVRRFFRENKGQDLTEWALLIAFISIGATAVMSQTGRPVTGIWTTANQVLQGQSVSNGGATTNSHDH